MQTWWKYFGFMNCVHNLKESKIVGARWRGFIHGLQPPDMRGISGHLTSVTRSINFRVKSFVPLPHGRVSLDLAVYPCPGRLHSERPRRVKKPDSEMRTSAAGSGLLPSCFFRQEMPPTVVSRYCTCLSELVQIMLDCFAWVSGVPACRLTHDLGATMEE